MPRSSRRPTLQMPLLRWKLLVGQCATPARRAAMSASSSGARCTACASTVHGPSSPCAS
jgi:hypothetical protein